jgi:predicted ATPase
MVSYRPGYSHPWHSKTYYTQLRLDALGSESAGEMFDALLGENAPLTDDSLLELKRLIIKKSEGTPLFMEEIVQALIEEGALVRNGRVKRARPLNTLKIPPTVQQDFAGRSARRISALTGHTKWRTQAPRWELCFRTILEGVRSGGGLQRT